MVHGTVTQVEIDQALIRDSHVFRDGLEIGHRIAIEPHRDRQFQVLDIRVLSPFHLREVAMVSHDRCLQYAHASFYVSLLSGEQQYKGFALSIVVTDNELKPPSRQLSSTDDGLAVALTVANLTAPDAGLF